MSIVIGDGGGKNPDAKTNGDGRLKVDSESNARIFTISKDFGEAFNAVMPSFSAAATEYVFYLKNTSITQNIVIESIEYHSVQAVHWKVWRVTGTAAGGTVITPTNLNFNSSNAASATAMGGAATITGLTTVAQIGTHRTQATGEAGMTFGGALILGQNDAIAIEYDTGTTGLCEIDCIFYYE